MVAFLGASPLGGDVEKIGDFQRREICSHGTMFLTSPLGGDVEKIGNYQKIKYVFGNTYWGRWWENGH